MKDELKVPQKKISDYVKKAKKSNSFERATRMLCSDEIVTYECPKCDTKFSFTEGTDVPKGTQCPFCKVSIVKSKAGIDRRKDIERSMKEDNGEPAEVLETEVEPFAVTLVVKSGHLPSELAAKMLKDHPFSASADIVWSEPGDAGPIPRMTIHATGETVSGNELVKRLRQI